MATDTRVTVNLRLPAREARTAMELGELIGVQPDLVVGVLVGIGLLAQLRANADAKHLITNLRKHVRRARRKAKGRQP